MKRLIRGTFKILATNIYIYISLQNLLFIFPFFFLIQLWPSCYTKRQLLEV